MGPGAAGASECVSTRTLPLALRSSYTRANCSRNDDAYLSADEHTPAGPSMCMSTPEQKRFTRAHNRVFRIILRGGWCFRLAADRELTR